MTTEELKYTKIGLLVLVSSGVVYYVVKNLGNNSQPDPTGNGTTVGTGGAGGNYNFNAKKVATELFDAMKEANFSHNNIVDILMHVNQTQFGEVVKAFGKKSYNKYTGNQYGIFDLPLEPLKVWLFEELSTADYRVLKLKYPNYL